MVRRGIKFAPHAYCQVSGIEYLGNGGSVFALHDTLGFMAAISTKASQLHHDSVYGEHRAGVDHGEQRAPPQLPSHLSRDTSWVSQAVG
jgi:hypothetical protein